MPDLTANKTELKRLLYSNDFYEFVKYFWDCVSPEPFQDGLHVQAICYHLQLVSQGIIKRLLINCPIRHGKSLLTEVFFPVYSWLRKPGLRIISATYAQALTERDASRSRALIDHPKFKELFPGWIKLVEGQNRKDYYVNSNNGHRLSVSIGSRTSGFDADLVLCDDLHDFATRTSDNERKGAIDYFENSLSSRLVLGGSDANVPLQRSGPCYYTSHGPELANVV